jgi:hypothetical protein
MIADSAVEWFPLHRKSKALKKLPKALKFPVDFSMALQTHPPKSQLRFNPDAFFINFL